uniref:Uncharacterized protein n=1 Tax=viral metagenome TaxID=1070528 RepID=A0A6C0IC20_9ZZZZ
MLQFFYISIVFDSNPKVLGVFVRAWLETIAILS